MRNFFSVLLIIILTVVTPVLLIVFSVRTNIVSATFIKTELAKRDIYDLALNKLDESITKITIDPQYPITNAEITDIAHRVLTRDWLQGNVESILDHFFAWLNGPEGTTLSIPINLAEPKAAITREVDTLLTTKLALLQPCPNKRVPKEEQGICQFAGMTVPQVKEQLSHAGLNPDIINQVLPDTIDLVNPDLSKITGPDDATNPEGAAAKSVEIKEKLNQFKARYRQIMFLMNIVFGIYLLLVALYIAINSTRGGWHRMTRWTGVLLLTIGIIPLALGIASIPVVQDVLLPKLHIDSNLPPEVQTLLPQLILDARSALFTTILVFGIVCVTLGLGGIIGAHWLPKPEKKS